MWTRPNVQKSCKPFSGQNIPGGKPLYQNNRYGFCLEVSQEFLLSFMDLPPVDGVMMMMFPNSC